MRNPNKPVGWRREPVRHGLAAKGISTTTTKSEAMSKVPAKEEYSINEIHDAWASGNPISWRGNKYTVHQMSYGDYFLEPFGKKSTERDFPRGTVFMERINKDKFKVERQPYE